MQRHCSLLSVAVAAALVAVGPDRDHRAAVAFVASPSGGAAAAAAP